ncbi:MAG: glycosyltransferase [Pseudomonadales bacterium]|nr:glycosyltransferase [Pseudomonadales bacterium]
MPTRTPNTILAGSVPASGIARLALPQRLLLVAYLGVALWYLSWRPSSFNPDDLVFSWLVYVAEVFGFVCSALYIIMCWSLKQRIAPQVPPGVTSDVFVPTINESVDIVRRTLMSALRMAHVGEVWLLDDGNRQEMRHLADQLGCRYVSRSDNSHAKAGNLNNALAQCSADYIAIFDADHAPMPNFLAETLGFMSDARVAFVQTPQDFYNLDSFQYRQDPHARAIWSEQLLFFRIIQPGKDRMNASFFCGSCAVVRRTAIDSIGGFATGTVTEDIHTSLRLHKDGWKSVFYGRSLAFGIAPATAKAFLKQRLRWGQGAMQTWRMEGVLTARGLTLEQRLSYLATLIAYFEGWQRAILFMAPVAVLLFGIMPIAAVDYEFLKRFIPYFVLSYWAFEETSRGYGGRLLNEQFLMIRFGVFIAATFALFMRNLEFVVTPKGMGEREATLRLLWPQWLVLALSLGAVPIGVLRYWQSGHLPFDALVANVVWAGIIAIIAVSAIRHALRVASYRRREYRFPLTMPFRVHGPESDSLMLVKDLSPAGCRLWGTGVAAYRSGDTLSGELLLPDGRVPVQATVRAIVQGDSDDRAPGTQARIASAGCEFVWESPERRTALELFLYGSDLQWRFNGMAERTPTPIERISRHVARAARQLRQDEPPPALNDWRPLVFRRPASLGESSVGFISVPTAPNGERRLVTLNQFRNGSEVDGDEVTAAGPRHLEGRLFTAEPGTQMDSANLYWYRLTA